jgi:hypothetical protein
MLNLRTLPDWPRALCVEWAARYVGQPTVSAFLTEVLAGRIPAFIQLSPGRKAWLIEDLDRHLDGKRGKHRSICHDSLLEQLAAERDPACDGVPAGMTAEFDKAFAAREANERAREASKSTRQAEAEYLSRRGPRKPKWTPPSTPPKPPGRRRPR